MIDGYDEMGRFKVPRFSRQSVPPQDRFFPWPSITGRDGAPNLCVRNDRTGSCLFREFAGSSSGVCDTTPWPQFVHVVVGDPCV
jgi:hypothetical protein